MKKKVLLAGALLGLGLLGMSCALGGMHGSLYTSVQYPHDNAYYGDDNNSAMSKSGESCLANYLGIIAVGDASVAKAMEQGGIKNVATVDHSSKSFLVFWSQYCTIVKGN